MTRSCLYCGLVSRRRLLCSASLAICFKFRSNVAKLLTNGFANVACPRTLLFGYFQVIPPSLLAVRAGLLLLTTERGVQGIDDAFQLFARFVEQGQVPYLW